MLHLNFEINRIHNTIQNKSCDQDIDDRPVGPVNNIVIELMIKIIKKLMLLLLTLIFWFEGGGGPLLFSAGGTTAQLSFDVQ